MKSTFFCRLSALIVALFALMLVSPAEAKKAATPAPVAKAAVPAPAAEATPTPPVTTTTSTDTPVATPPSAPVPATKAALPSSVTSGDVTMSHMSADLSHNRIDIFMTIKNNGSSDERLIGAGSTAWDIGEIVQVKKDKDGKEQESPVSINIPTGKSVELSSSDTWLRVKSIKTKPKDESVFPVSLYFRHSPNANLQISTGGAKSGVTGAIEGWFSK